MTIRVARFYEDTQTTGNLRQRSSDLTIYYSFYEWFDGRIPSGQYVDKNNCMQRISDGKKWEGTGKTLKISWWLQLSKRQ